MINNRKTYNEENPGAKEGEYKNVETSVNNLPIWMTAMNRKRKRDHYRRTKDRKGRQRGEELTHCMQ